jgi:hypothetical protein
MKILILCDQTQCTFNKEQRRAFCVVGSSIPEPHLLPVTVCTHPIPHITLRGSLDNKHTCLSIDKRVDDSHETDIAPIQESICVHCRHRAGFCAGNDLYITQCKRFEHI